MYLGQERYRSLAPIYYRAAAVALVVFDLTDYNTFTGAKNWIDELHKQGSPDIIIGLAGNKCDLGARRVSSNEASSYAEENGLIYMETSAKTGENVRELVIALARLIPAESENPPPSDIVNTVDNNAPIVTQSTGCCY